MGLGFLSWLNDLFEGPEQYGIPSVTLTGQQVRSRGEKIIADYLTYHGVAYNYEAQAMSNDWFIFKQKISRPDFFLPQYNLFVEYWGLVDSPDPRTRNNYVRAMRWKMAQYRKNNIRFISIYPSNLNNLDYNFKRKFSETMGFNLPTGPVVSTCPTCQAPILDMPLHKKWHTQTAELARHHSY